MFRQLKSICLWQFPRVMAVVALFASIGETVGAQVQTGSAAALDTTRPALPPVDTTATVTQAQARVDAVLAARVNDVERQLESLKALSKGTKTDDRIRALEGTIQVLERRNQIERTRLLGASRGRYTNGYKLLSDMETKAKGLVAAGTAVSALSAVTDLTDLRKYPGFSAAFSTLQGKIKDNAERSWFTQLVDSVIPKVMPVASLAGLGPVVSAAGFALTQLRNIIPAYANERLGGQQFVRTYQDLTCGLNSVSALHDELATLAALNARWTGDVDSLVKAYPAMLAKYRTTVKLPDTNVADVTFYSAVQTTFDQQSAVSQEDFLAFSEVVTGLNAEFERAARTYFIAVTRHLDYWERLKQMIVARRDTPCIGSDASAKKKFDDAIVAINGVVKEVRDAYLFGATDRPENEYFRLITQN